MEREIGLKRRGPVLKGFYDAGYNVIIKEEQSNGVWFRLKKGSSDITVSLWMDNDGSFRFQFEDWT